MNAETAFRGDEPWPPAPLALSGLPAALDAFSAEPSDMDRQPTGQQLDYEACLDYVRQVGSAMRAAAARVRTREATAEEISRQAREQISRADAALRQSEERVREAAFKIHDAEARANRAEARAAEAEAWLNRLFDTMQQELKGTLAGPAGDPADTFLSL